MLLFVPRYVDLENSNLQGCFFVVFPVVQVVFLAYSTYRTMRTGETCFVQLF